MAVHANGPPVVDTTEQAIIPEDQSTPALLGEPVPQNFVSFSLQNNKSQARFNEIDVQHISDTLHQQIFGADPPTPPPELVELAKEHLTLHDLLGKQSAPTEPIGFDLPKLLGSSLDEHFFKIGTHTADPWRKLAEDFATKTLAVRPATWSETSGWTKYDLNGNVEKIGCDPPKDKQLVFDVEVLYKISPYAVLACAAGPEGWYSWISPQVLDESNHDKHLISLGDPKNQRIVIGHNVSYDRARIAEEYSLKPTGTFFLDTMSMHAAVNGMCARQRPTWMKHRKNQELREKLKENMDPELSSMMERAAEELEPELWVEHSSINSLRDVAQFHCQTTISKETRDMMGEMKSVTELRPKLQECLRYCAADVEITHRVYKAVLPRFLETCPHPVSFSALRHMGSLLLPVNSSWQNYVNKSEATYMELSQRVKENLISLTEQAVAITFGTGPKENNAWISQLDWTGREIRYKKQKKSTDPLVPVARQKLPGYPNWYKDLFPKTDSPMNISVRIRVAPLMLRLQWDGYPLVWTDKHGWTFRVPFRDLDRYDKTPMVRCDDLMKESNPHVANDTDAVYFKLPHNGNGSTRCVSPLAKGYQRYFEDGVLTSEFAQAKEALDMNAACSYWISARERIKSQFVVWENPEREQAKLNMGFEQSTRKDLGLILPQIVTMGTITRRAVENTWLTASNAKTNRVGSELKAMIQAPPGYCFVGADVDSEELWIASLIGDAEFKMHGGNAIGFMTLEGSKAAGTDMHSRTAGVLGISRNNAKVFNYGRIYGAGLKFAASLLRQFNPKINESEANVIAGNLYTVTKGAKTIRKVLSDRPFWRGGTESFVFNRLEEFAEQEIPRTPVLGAAITEALQKRHINKGAFLTSRINWAIQSSGVDYLHLLIVSMDYLIQQYKLNARLMITVHDEIRYIVKVEDRYKVAMALQVANLWTRSMFAQQMGINDLPQSCAFFSAVDIDHVLRKEVDLDCVTPSNPTPIPHGESVDIGSLLAKEEAQLPIGSEVVDINVIEKGIPYVNRVPVMEDLSKTNTYMMRAQVAKKEKDLNKVMKEMRIEAPELLREWAFTGKGPISDHYAWDGQGTNAWDYINMQGQPLKHAAEVGYGWNDSSSQVTKPVRKAPKKQLMH
ncbi:hypothetical protein ABW20_dc0104321 [Dactylellina cionopaga]|nr:hypothetical protein ABW20_dc0104321 [Dactylellina cionopaga]